MVTTLVYSNRAMQRKDSGSSGNRRNSFLTAPVSFLSKVKSRQRLIGRAIPLRHSLKETGFEPVLLPPEVTLFYDTCFLSFHGCCYLLKQNYTVNAHCFYAVEIYLKNIESIISPSLTIPKNGSKIMAAISNINPASLKKLSLDSV